MILGILTAGEHSFPFQFPIPGKRHSLTSFITQGHILHSNIYVMLYHINMTSVKRVCREDNL